MFPGYTPSYPTVCIPPPPSDLDCGDVPYRNFPVLPPDPHNFDADNDGIGCEVCAAGRSPANGRNSHPAADAARPDEAGCRHGDLDRPTG